ncbi:MAG: M28 family peptidase [Inconstantimicrobium porci]|uniref:M28 family peptidase n=1 Tax=Inconstantimicrobium porci TaxID=2652291 RepID=UPI002A90FC74|nr:M28 family peptidase [Inconstantimicrobium porci]MDY5910770.1 M28 family peptidase [Inconstantimicrobium porci]
MKKKINWVIVLASLMFILATLTFGWSYKKEDIVWTADESINKSIEKNINKFSDELEIRNIKNIDNLNKAKDYIANELEECGFEVTVQEFECQGKTVANVIGRKKGTKKSDSKIVLCTNYDSNIKKGVDAQNSGIAALLSIAEQMKGKESNRDIEVTAFVNLQRDKENSEFPGSSVYIDKLKKQNEKVAGVIVIDSIGRYSEEILTQRYPFNGINNPNRGNYVAVISDKNSASLNKDISGGMKKISNFPVLTKTSNIVLEKQKSAAKLFWENNYNAVILTDTGIYRSDDINTKEDTKEKINYKYMAQVMNNLTGAVLNY